jgi:hypothetical protein
MEKGDQKEKGNRFQRKDIRNIRSREDMLHDTDKTVLIDIPVIMVVKTAEKGTDKEQGKQQ